MKHRHRAALVLSLICGLAIAAAPAAAATQPNWHQRLRGIVGQTQNDVQAAQQLEQGPAERKRYVNVQRKLAAFDRSLAKGHYRPAELKIAIGALQNVLSHNTLQASTRDALNADHKQLQTYYNAHH